MFKIKIKTNKINTLSKTLSLKERCKRRRYELSPVHFKSFLKKQIRYLDLGYCIMFLIHVIMHLSSMKIHSTMSRENLYTFIPMKYYLAPDSVLHYALYLAPDSKIEKINILVPFQATIDPKNNFTQNTLHSSFISKKKMCPPSQMLLETPPLYPIYTSFHSR